MTDCELLRIDKKVMTEALHREHEFSDMFVANLLAGTCDTKRIWWTISSTPAKRDWLGFCCCWLASVRKAYPSL